MKETNKEHDVNLCVLFKVYPLTHHSVTMLTRPKFSTFYDIANKIKNKLTREWVYETN